MIRNLDDAVFFMKDMVQENFCVPGLAAIATTAVFPVIFFIWADIMENPVDYKKAM